MGKDAKWTYAELQNKFQNIDFTDFWKEYTIFVIENCIPLEKNMWHLATRCQMIMPSMSEDMSYLTSKVKIRKEKWKLEAKKLKIRVEINETYFKKQINETKTFLRQ